MRLGGLVPSSLLARLKWTAYLGLCLGRGLPGLCYHLQTGNLMVARPPGGSLALGGQGQAWEVAAAAVVVSDSPPSSVSSVKPFVQQAYPIQPAVTAPIPGESLRDPLALFHSCTPSLTCRAMDAPSLPAPSLRQG